MKKHRSVTDFMKWGERIWAAGRRSKDGFSAGVPAEREGRIWLQWITEGRSTRRCRRDRRDCLNSAGNWGIVDMLGGGLITTFIKRSKMKDADLLVQQARSALKRFQKELTDVENIPEFRIETGDFLTFADYFFDGLVADWLVQSKINDARRQVENAMVKINYIMGQLKGL